MESGRNRSKSRIYNNPVEAGFVKNLGIGSTAVRLTIAEGKGVLALTIYIEGTSGRLR
jgi:hypothetical protein